MGAADDIAVALSGTAPDSVILPKTAGPEDVDRVTALLSEVDIDYPVFALVESAAGVLDAAAIAAAAATDALVFGAEDLAGEIGATRTQEGDEVAYARQSVVLAARAAGVTPIDTHVPNYTNMGELRRATNRAVQLGYDGKLAIHPEQVSVINKSFTPSQKRIEWAKRILSARDGTDEAVFTIDGEMIDAPQIRQAERVLERAALGDD